ncbi:short-chain dehydrogenase/reductase SDR [Beutenbergia cavernae DSM 12333]|uniref:Short-chain dehydrogenase/reductase SDR n=2 Tax=Beutenbergia cavernae (strain ATCC BAA-8 / DSM 12333 / CCUG 43141 / JCM 11478 / NBRC 16432 / NCIMB 13614 / HKI 0122) TaxID=471853 RepID=C5BY10_BEUC1|nr:SDR family oxidoreductase [Beutenbergia cavernae]ACQ78904.1 short-chain dehydrogenase/reductase SDR [Beutenbergia cavernae DSM 12333]
MTGPFSLAGRTAVVTGAGSGIGRAIAHGYARAGAHVLAWGRTDGVKEVADEIADGGGSAEAVVADLADLEGAANVAEELAATRRVDVLVNNAGIIARAPAEEVSLGRWREVLTVNLDAAWVLSRSFGTAMLAHGSGRIVTIASMLSFQGGRNVAAYAASKHAVVGLTRALASEWAGRGVGVNALAPGYVVTANTAALRADDERAAEITARIPAGRWATPEDMVGPAVFLASDAASYVHGQVLAVDGGWLAS